MKMYIKIDKDGNLTEVVENFKAGCLEDNYEVDTDKLLFAKYVDGKIVYDDKSYKKHVKNRTILNNLVTEKMEIEEWLDNYDRICNEKMRCDRLQMECHHNIAKLDKIALDKIRKLSEINTAMANL